MKINLNRSDVFLVQAVSCVGMCGFAVLGCFDFSVFVQVGYLLCLGVWIISTVLYYWG